MVKWILMTLMAAPGLASALDLSRAHSCLMQVRAATGRAANATAFVLQLEDVAYIANAARLLQVTNPKASELTDGPVNFVSQSGVKSYAGIHKGNVMMFAGKKQGLPEVHITTATATDQNLADMVRNDIDTGLAQKDVDQSSAKDRIYRACNGLAQLNLPKDWKKSQARSDGPTHEGSLWEDILGGPGAGSAR